MILKTAYFLNIKKLKTKAKFVKNYHQFVTLPPRVLEMKKELLEKIDKIQVIAEKSKINQTFNPSASKVGIVTSGVSYLYAQESLKELKLKWPILKLGYFYPLPEEKVKKFILCLLHSYF